MSKAIPVLRWLLALFFIVAGFFHFLKPQPYMSMMPAYLPNAKLLIDLSGWAEIAGGIGLLIPFFRRIAAWGLLALLTAVFPANLNVALHGWPGVDFAPWVLWARLPFQLVFMWAVYVAALKR